MYLTRRESSMRIAVVLSVITLAACTVTGGDPNAPGPGASVGDAVGTAREAVSGAVDDVGYDADAARRSAATCASARAIGNVATLGIGGWLAQTVCQGLTGVVAGSSDGSTSPQK